MEKIVLKNGTEIEIQGGATENVITVPAADFTAIATLYEQTLTEANLETYSILNGAGSVCVTYTNKYVASVNVSAAAAGYTAAFHLQDVDMVAKRLSALENGQEIQDSAIVELAGMTGGE